jgi:hypothetical protein
MTRLLWAAPLALALLGGLCPAPADEPERLKPVNLGCNTADDEDDPHLADGGVTLYYSARRKGKVGLMVARRKAPRGPWPKGEPLEDYVATPGDDRSVFATEGRYPQYLYFATTKEKKGTNFDIYVAVKQGRGRAWSAPTPINPITTPADELHPWLTADGKQLFFSRRTKEGWRVFVARRPSGGKAQGFAEAELVKELPAGFHHATLTPDGKLMYLQGPLGKGRWGLFVSTRAAKGWGRPVPLEALNHPEGNVGDCSPNLSRTGVILYFASDRPGGKGGLDLYAIQTAQLRKKAMRDEG